nr:hypothetical protein [uncultured Oscillibacter sp.]
MEYEYMRALRQRFFVEPDMMTQREIEKGWRCLSDRVGREDQKRILGLMDMQAALLEETSLASFVAGFQLALGIAGELTHYSFASDEEDRAEERRASRGEAEGKR